MGAKETCESGWIELAVGPPLLSRLQPVEPLLLKMESGLSLFTIWRPHCSLFYRTAILPAFKIQLLGGERGPVNKRGVMFCRLMS